LFFLFIKGSVWNRLGSDVTVIEYLPEIGAGMDGEVAKSFQRILAKQGLKFQLSSKVTNVQEVGKSDKALPLLKVSFESSSGGGEKQALTFDAVLQCVGRRPFTDQLGLKEVGVQVDERGRIKVDKQFRTSVPSIRALGDVIPGPMLAHKAEEEGKPLYRRACL
jgi:dihydrolipoamide dehydrogenase